MDLQVIRDWRPDSNVAIRTGAESNLFVLDFDPRNGAAATIRKLEREHGPFPRESLVLTGGGGAHIYFQYPKGAAIASATNILGPGVDLKCDAGYIIASPSFHLSGNQYRWRSGAPPRRLPRAPKWLVEMARSKHSYQPRGADDDTSTINTADHPIGQLHAQVLGAVDRGHYWEIQCPCGGHESPDCSMYLKADGRLFFVCHSGNWHSHAQIERAVNDLVDAEATGAEADNLSIDETDSLVGWGED